MMLVAPSCSNRIWASRLDPSPTASIEITAATPKTMPRTVSPERSLCRSKLFSPSFRPRQMRPMVVSSVGLTGRARRPAGRGRRAREERSGGRHAPFGLPVGAGRGQLPHAGAGAVVDDHAVAHPDDPLGVLGDVVFVG